MIEADAHRLAERIVVDFPESRGLADPVWCASASTKVIDCVLSLRKPYKLVVEPRVQAFAQKHPGVRTCDDLLTLIGRFDSPEAFHTSVLDMNSPGKAAALVGVLEYLIDIQQRFDGGDEDARLSAWARWARPGDYLTLDVAGFKLAGFQYLRMLFGAETTKPDVHILRYAEDVLGRPIAGHPGREVQAVYALERAGEILGRSVRELDVAIWERGSGHRSTS
jgi:hypothetical protein